MIKNFLIRLLIKWYLKQNREISKMDIKDEFKNYKFNTRSDTLEILKKNLTAQTLWYWEADDKLKEQIKGAGTILKIMIDAHKKAVEIEESKKDDEIKIDTWKHFKRTNRTS